MASKRRVRRQKCGFKQRHATEAEAVAHATSLRYAGSPGVQAYRCPFCHQWHVGHWRRREEAA